MPTGRDHRYLIAEDCQNDVSQITEKISATSLGYLSLVGTIRSVISTTPVLPGYENINEENFCVACFKSNSYHIPLDVYEPAPY